MRRSRFFSILAAAAAALAFAAPGAGAVWLTITTWIASYCSACRADFPTVAPTRSIT